MAFDYTNLYPDTSGNGGYTKSWNYTTLDPIATVSASGYFNKVATRVGIGDNIIVSVVDAFDKTRTTLVAFATLYVNSISGGVVTTISSTTGLLNNAALTGTPTAPTAAVDTTTSQIATTAFVIQQAASAIPLMDSTGTVGISTRYARADHVHPIDTSRAPTVAPTFTGTAAFASMTASGTFALTGDFSVNTNKFTVTAASGNTSVAGTLLVTGATTLSAALTYGGVTLSNAVTGTGNMVLSAAPTISGHPTIEGVTSTGATGTGNLVFSATPTFTGTATFATASATTLLGGTGGLGNASPKTTLDVNANLSSSPALAVSTSVLRVQGADNVSGGQEWISYVGSNSLTGNILSGAVANGTSSSPTATGTGGGTQYMFNLRGYGWTGSAWAAGGLFIFQNNGIWSGSNQGTDADIYTTPNGSTTIARAARFNASGGLSIGTTTDAGIGAILANTSIKSQSATAGVGYATGAGGAITQGTSRTTGVTLNTVTGAITLFSAAGSTTPASFTVTNSAVAATDVVHVCQKSGTDLYEIFVTAVAAGSFKITFFTTGGTTTEQPVFNFAIIKGVTS